MQTNISAMNRKLIAALLLFALILCESINGQDVIPAAVFGDHMVIQQGINPSIWGTAKPGAHITVAFAGFVTSGIADHHGKWMIKMPVLSAGGPHAMKICSTDTIIFRDVMVGEVWLASGQSNMEWTIGSGIGPTTEIETASADFPMIRFFTVPKKTSSMPLGDTEKQDWVICSPETVKNFSAVAYFFARELTSHRNVAVGVISSAWGATGAEAWISSDMLATHPDFRERILQTDTDTSKWNGYVRKCIAAENEREIIARTSKKGFEAGAHNSSFDDSGWEKCMSPVDMPSMGLNGYWGLVWLRKYIEIPYKVSLKEMKLELNIRAKDALLFLNGTEVAHLVNPAGPVSVNISPDVLRKGKNVLAVRLYVNWGSAQIGTKDVEPYLLSYDKKTKISLGGEWLFNSAIEPAVAQWQDYYNKPTVLFNARIAPLIPYGIRGVIWYQGENNAGNGYQYRSLFPLLIEDWRVRWQLGYFPFLYVQLANYMEKQSEPDESDWAELREAQLMTLKYPNTGMAVTIDIGDPGDIHPRNKLDVGKRLFLLAQNIAYNENITSSGPLYESSSIEGQKIRLRFKSSGTGLGTIDNMPVRGFAIAGDDKKFYWAEAVIDGNEVQVSSPEVPAPRAVRYSWEDNPDGNLINSEGLPASPFRTDDWSRASKL
jgi:sialate O-acetylesterase